MNPLNRPWGECPAAAPNAKAAQAERPATNSVLDDEARGLELEIAQARDRMWRAQRRNELQAKLGHAGDQERLGIQIAEWAVLALVLGIFAAFFGYRLEPSSIGSAAWIVAIVALLAAGVTFALGWLLRLTARGRRAALLEHARRQAIDIEDYDPKV